MKKSSLTLKLINAPYMIWAVLFILAPLIMVIYYAFTDRSGAFTLDNIKALSSYGAIFGRSAWYAVLATVICLILAYPLAYIMAKSRANTQRTIMMLIMLPMWMNFLLRTYSWMSLLEDNGLINTVLRALGFNGVQLMYNSGAVLLGMVYNFLPFMVFPIYTLLSKMDYRLTEAAADLGCNNWQTLWKVTTEALATLHGLGNAVDVDKLFDQLFATIIVTTATTTTIVTATATATAIPTAIVTATATTTTTRFALLATIGGHCLDDYAFGLIVGFISHLRTPARHHARHQPAP